MKKIYNANMQKNKVVTIPEAVKKFVKPDISIYLAGFAYSEPFAFVYEIIRQKNKNLFVIKTSGGLMVDMLLGAGCIKKLLISHVWNSVGPVPAHNFRRTFEKKKAEVELEEMSFGVLTLALFAAAHHLPFMPTQPILGSGQFTHRGWMGKKKYGVVKNPFNKNENVVLVPPVKPQLGIFHVQRADEDGNAQVTGPLAELKVSAAASDEIILSAEEIVSRKEIKKYPESTIIPSFCVKAVCHTPYGGHPSDVYGYYHRDIDFYSDYGKWSKTKESFQAFLKEWIYDTKNHDGYIKKLGKERLKKIAAK